MARRHYKEVEDCNVIMSYGFVVIILLLTAIYAFVMIFSDELRSTFEEYEVFLPAFFVATLALSLLNLILA